VKRCKLKSRPVLSHGTQVLLGAGVRVLGLSFIAMLSKEQDLFAKTVTTASAEALAKAEQLTHIVRVSC
jgi:hypothetical protein